MLTNQSTNNTKVKCFGLNERITTFLFTFSFLRKRHKNPMEHYRLETLKSWIRFSICIQVRVCVCVCCFTPHYSYYAIRDIKI